MSDRLFARRTGAWFLSGLCLVALLSLGSETALAWQEKKAEPAAAEPAAAEPVAAEPAAAEPAAADAADGETDPDAPAADADAGGGASESYLVRFMKALGWFFGPIFLVISFTLVALIMMNVLQIRRDILLPPGFVDDFEQQLAGKDYQGAYEIARTDDSMVARVLTAGLTKLNRGYAEAVEGMQEVGEDENMALEHRLSYLALIGSIAPMIGLAGTVTGMILSFDKIASSATQPEPAELAEGIATALWTTLVGLGIAIPAMISYSILRNRVARLVLEVGGVSESLMGRFQSLGRSKPASGGAPTAAPAAPQQ
ncbi:MAG: MotA/TolQ/ExbB proton channel family protein [Planctomycetaceae bacterium]